MFFIAAKILVNDLRDYSPAIFFFLLSGACIVSARVFLTYEREPAQSAITITGSVAIVFGLGSVLGSSSMVPGREFVFHLTYFLWVGGPISLGITSLFVVWKKANWSFLGEKSRGL